MALNLATVTPIHIKIFSILEGESDLSRIMSDAKDVSFAGLRVLVLPVLPERFTRSFCADHISLVDTELTMYASSDL